MMNKERMERREEEEEEKEEEMRRRGWIVTGWRSAWCPPCTYIYISGRTLYISYPLMIFRFHPPETFS